MSYAINRYIEPLFYKCAKCQHSPVTHVPYVKIYIDPRLHLCQMPGLHIYTCAMYKKIGRPRFYNSVKFKHSSVTPVTYACRQSQILVIFVPNDNHLQLKTLPYVSIYMYPKIIILPNASSRELHMCHFSADT